MAHKHLTEDQLIDLITAGEPLPADAEACNVCREAYENLLAVFEPGRRNEAAVGEALFDQLDLPSNLAEFADYVKPATSDTGKVVSFEPSHLPKVSPVKIWAAAAGLAAILFLSFNFFYGLVLPGSEVANLTKSVAVERPGFFFGSWSTTTQAPWQNDRITFGSKTNLPLKDASIVASTGSRLSVTSSSDQMKIKLLAGIFQMTFEASERQRVVAINPGQELTIKGTTLFIKKAAGESLVFLKEGSAELTGTGELKAGLLYRLTSQKIGSGPATAKSLQAFRTAFPGAGLETKLTLSDIKEQYKSLSKVVLYNGKQIKGAVIKTGPTVSIMTPNGLVKVAKDEIAEMTPLP